MQMHGDFLALFARLDRLHTPLRCQQAHFLKRLADCCHAGRCHDCWKHVVKTDNGAIIRNPKSGLGQPPNDPQRR